MSTFACRVSRKPKNGKLSGKSCRSLESASTGKESVVVALSAGKEIARHALEWALTNVVQEGDRITLICVLHAGKLGSRRLWSLPKLAGDCANRPSKSQKIRTSKETEEEARESCSQSLQHLHKLCDAKKVNVCVKLVSGASKGAVSMEARSLSATWVVLDSQLKKEEAKLCLEQLQCNLVMVKKNDAKILQLSLRVSSESGRDVIEGAASSISFSECASVAAAKEHDEGNERKSSSNHGSPLHSKVAFPASEEAASSSSPEVRTPFTATEKGTSSVSSSEHGASPYYSTEVVKTCTGHNNETDVAEIDDSDVGSEYDLVDALSVDDSSNDESCGDMNASPMLHLRGSVNSDIQPYGSNMRCPKSSNVQPSHYCRTQGDHFPIDPWRITKTRPSSADATPIMGTQNQGRLSTPASPLGSSKQLTGNSRLSFSMREGGSAIHQANPSLGCAKGNAVFQQKRSKHLPNPTYINSFQSFDPEKPTCFKNVLTAQQLIDKFSTWYPSEAETGDDTMHRNGELERISSVRKAVSLSKHAPRPPPLCSICQHKAPVFGKPPRRFTYAELELATGGFSPANFLAEGGFGSVHRGVLPDGQAVAVKQHKLASSQGDLEFCSEVEVLSCAQHRNVVMLIGYCIEGKRRLLVYEYICNGSLDAHLYGRDTDCLEWLARQKIAVSAARGLRYLHEECRVGCIVHRDMRPNNILLTHDFEPMVGDFGLARWQPDGDLGVQTRVIGTFGYLAPEYAQSGQVTEKADVYSFGVVLLELATGRKAVDLNKPKGQQCLTEWARSLLEQNAVDELIDPRLDGNCSEYEVYCMLHAASLCIRKDPTLRPRMSQVLRILEGDVVIDKSILPTSSYKSTLTYDTSVFGGSRSSRMFSEYAVSRATACSPLVSYSGSMAINTPGGRGSTALLRDPLVSCQANGKLTYEALKAAYKGRAHTGRSSYEDI